MKLLIDVGNTSLKAALFNNDAIYACNIKEAPWGTVTEVIYACVGKSELLDEVIRIAKAHKVPCFQATVSNELAGLKCAYEQVNNLGIDRWLAIIACFKLYPATACIIIDAGTATTIDVLNTHGEHLGGWILPGLDLMTSSLTSNTQRVFDDELTEFEKKLGKNTPNGLKNGALVATIGAIEQAAQQIAEQNLSIVFAGGYGQLLSHYFSSSIFEPMLVMKGLNYWRNLSKAN
jgi:type III pantothenate kinase